MKSSLSEKSEEILILLKTLILLHVLGGDQSSFKTSNLVNVMGNSLNQDNFNDNKKIILQENDSSKLQTPQRTKTLISSDECHR